MARKRTKSRRSKPRSRKSEVAATAIPKAAPAAAIKLRPLGINDAPTRAFGVEARDADGRVPNTIIYIHGIGNKPPASVLKCQWDMALFNAALGDRSRMAYWVNKEYYPDPLDETCAAGDVVDTGDGPATRSIMGIAGTAAATVNVNDEIAALAPGDPVRQAWLKRVAAKMAASTAVTPAEMRTRNVRAKVIPLPEFLRQLIARNLTRLLLRDVNDFLFVPKRREAMEKSLLDRLEPGGGPFVVISHSQGTMVAYNVLRQLDPDKFPVPLFVTIGSPLGMQEVQDVLRQWTGGKLPFPPCVKRWVNVADRLDPVAIDNDISNDFEGKIVNESGIGINEDSPWHPHSGTGYLRTNKVKTEVFAAVGTAFRQAVSPFAIAKDLVTQIEDGVRTDRHRTLIQLVKDQNLGTRDRDGLDRQAAAITKKIKDLVAASGESADEVPVERLRHFLSAELTRGEIEALRSHYHDLSIAGIWRNAKKRALITDSIHTIQVRPAQLGYGTSGRKIAWAVLDTGIRADHPHFQKYKNVVAQWDCTTPREATPLVPGSDKFNKLDGNGHGTHVAGIIAGEHLVASGEHFIGLAPECSLYGFKVLNNRGEGDDGWIIRALDLIADINDRAGGLAIHGVNLSLGGEFDPSVFGCGHTPLCQELRRLWRQGVLVLLAAGNEGFAVLRSNEGDIQANLDLSIGDPANLDEAIAVGSIHKTNPHTYGISYFSSRGPTADGRRKPDLVAPGEKIVSARHDWDRNPHTAEKDRLYVEMSGTSMATPHVSGLLAAFLSLRREFIGYPDRVKSLLLNSCVDLQRDPYMQGAGMPNLIKMLALN